MNWGKILVIALGLSGINQRGIAEIPVDYLNYYNVDFDNLTSNGLPLRQFEGTADYGSQRIVYNAMGLSGGAFEFFPDYRRFPAHYSQRSGPVFIASLPIVLEMDLAFSDFDEPNVWSCPTMTAPQPDNFEISIGSFNPGIASIGALIYITKHGLVLRSLDRNNYFGIELKDTPDSASVTKIRVNIQPEIHISNSYENPPNVWNHTWGRDVTVWIDSQEVFSGELTGEFQTSGNQRYSDGDIFTLPVETHFHFNDLTHENCSLMTAGARVAVDNFKVWMSAQDVERSEHLRLSAVRPKWRPANRRISKSTKTVTVLLPSELSTIARVRVGKAPWKAAGFVNGRLNVKLPRSLRMGRSFTVRVSIPSSFIPRHLNNFTKRFQFK